MPEHVTELRQHGDDQCRQQQLRCFRPVVVGRIDAQVPGDLARQRNVVALQDAAGKFDEEQEADQTEGHGPK